MLQSEGAGAAESLFTERWYDQYYYGRGGRRQASATMDGLERPGRWMRDTDVEMNQDVLGHFTERFLLMT